ncbi:MAG: 16S rRNA (adenine(1518)-N(6)/adenine(1519)-N(6))-dimethyltransferase RsmA [Phycisphaeraceae bacterium]
MQTLTDIKAMLAAHGLFPKHRLGQNFLHDANKMAAILDAAAVGKGDTVLEVGPGTGALTEQLLQRGARVVAVEIDRDLEPILREQLAVYDQCFALLMEDVLESKRLINPRVLAALPRDQPFKLIANLPYNVASPLLANLAADHPAMTLAIVMVQREVADRLTAEPGSKDYGPLGVMAQAMCQVRRIATLPPSCFWPQPKVDSAVIQLLRRPQPMTGNPHALGELLHSLFSKRRKQLGTILGRQTPLPPDIDPQDRPEQLSVEQLCRLAGILVTDS